MYNSNLAAAVRVDGKVLREFGDKVYMPFSSEYSIFIKNMNTKRALVHISIDGETVTEDGLVVNAGSSVDLERFVTENLSEGNRFKFIERTNKIEEHRGIDIEDGLIKIEFEYEKETVFVFPSYPSYPSYPYYPYYPYYNSTWDNKIAESSNSFGGPNVRDVNICASNTTLISSVPIAKACVNEDGITVKGSHSDQTFQTVSSFATDGIKNVIIIKVLGETEAKKIIREPVIVKRKPKCKTCGVKNNARAKFCSECGTSLISY